MSVLFLELLCNNSDNSRAAFLLCRMRVELCFSIIRVLEELCSFEYN